MPAVATKQHDTSLCHCAIGGLCTCPCKRCQESRDREFQIKRLQELEDRLKRADIEPDDFAEMIWRRVESTIEARIERIVTEQVRNMLKSVVLVSRASKSSLENWEQ